MRRLLCTLSLSLLAVGCATTGGPFGGSDSSLREQVEELQRRVLELQRKAAVSEVEIARLRERLIELQLLDRQEGGSAASAGGPPEDRSLIDPPKVIHIEDVGEPSGVAEPAPAQEDAPQRLTVEEPPSNQGGATPAAAPRGGARAEGGKPTPAAGEAIYDRGYTLYNQGQFVEAETSFQRFLQQYADTELADNAQYWIGESRFSRRDYRGALAAFRETVRRFPEGNKVPDALLKAGRSLEELGDASGALASYRELQRRFPESALALEAGDRIRALR